MWAFRITLNLTLEKSVSPVISGSLQGTLYRFPLDCLLAARSNFLSLILEPPWSSVVMPTLHCPLLFFLIGCQFIALTFCWYFMLLAVIGVLQ